MVQPRTKNGNKPEESLLQNIQTPDGLRRLERSELVRLCSEIRSFLISELSQNPGHFASSMGAVELTVALHYVFNTPYDRIVWDVGHQAYAHKILTGRRDKFHTNRKLNGISGFPTPKESEYDTFTAGHASNSISAALGMAVAAKLNGDKRHVVAVIGDASIAGGLAFEGLNNAANTPNDLLIILNDNDMSIDKAQGALNTYLAKLTASRPYNNFRHKAYKGLRKLRLISDKSRGAVLRFNNSLKALLNRSQNLFEGLDIRYFGPFDGHDINRLIKVLNQIKDMKGPKILHLCTVKGKGYLPAENDPASWHAPGKFDPATGERISSGDATKYQDILGRTLVELAAVDPKIVGITAAMPSGTSLNLLNEKFPERTFDVGISEGHAVTFAAGLAKEGLKPYVAIYSSFLQRAYDNIIHDSAIASLPVVYCIDRAGLVGEDGVTHHGVYDLSYLNAVPGITLCAPSSGQMLADLLCLTATTKIEGPWAIRYPRGSAFVQPEGFPYVSPQPGKANIIASPAHPKTVLVSIGSMLKTAIEVADNLNAKGIPTAIIDAIFLKPLDFDTIKKAVTSDSLIVTLEDGTIKGGLYTTVASYANEQGLTNPILPVGVPDTFVAQGSVAELHRLCQMDSESITAKILEVLK